MTLWRCLILAGPILGRRRSQAATLRNSSGWLLSGIAGAPRFPYSGSSFKRCSIRRCLGQCRPNGGVECFG